MKRNFRDYTATNAKLLKETDTHITVDIRGNNIHLNKNEAFYFDTNVYIKTLLWSKLISENESLGEYKQLKML